MALLDIQLRPSQSVQLKSPPTTATTATSTSTVLPKFEDTFKAANGEDLTVVQQQQQQQQQQQHQQLQQLNTAANEATGTEDNHHSFLHHAEFRTSHVKESATTPASALSTPPAVRPKVEYESSGKPSTFQSPSYKTGDIISHPLPTPPSKLKSHESPSLPSLGSNNESGSFPKPTDNTNLPIANHHSNATAKQQPQQPSTSQVSNENGSSSSSRTNLSSPVCRNCKTQTTPLWRRDETGQVLCNACGLFLKLHGRPRPISLKTDTIKSRNRVKQNGAGGTHSSKAGASASSTNNPELKSKDSKSGRKSPKLKKYKNGVSGNSNGVEYTPLLPASTTTTTSANANSPAIFKQDGTGNNISNNNNGASGSHSFNNLTSINGNGYYQQRSLHHTPHFPPHLPNHVLQAHQQVPLHYPSSTPTQFAPGLRRITSPLMLSTTTSSSAVRNEPIAGGTTTTTTGTNANANANANTTSTVNASSTAESNSMHAAAGVLENLSNELGPSATFKPEFGIGSRQKGISLMSNKERPSGSAMSTATGSSSSIFSSVTPPQLPRLPALSTKSPAFSAVQSRSSTPTLPPLHKVATGEITLPSLNSFTTQLHVQLLPHQNQQQSSSSIVAPPHQQQIGSEQPSHTPSRDETPRGDDDKTFKDRDNSNSNSNNNSNNNSNGNSNGNNSNNNNNNGSNTNPNHEVTILKTRISELELVNDLYRTRIMELEAMEHAARLRETSMRKRLEEAVELQASQLDEYNRKQELNASRFGVGSGQRLLYHRPNDPEIAAAVSNAKVVGYQLYLPQGDQQMAQAQRLGIQLSERLGQSQKQQQQRDVGESRSGSSSRSNTPKPGEVPTHDKSADTGFKLPSLKRDNENASSTTQGKEKKSKLK